MNLETNRLITFANWPTSAPVDSIRIAKAGFFYTGQGTEVQCFSCGGKISDWNYGDQVMGRHRQLDPNCTFVGNPQLSGNVPLVVGNDCPSVVDTNPSSSIRSAGEENPESNDSSQDYGLNEDDEMYKSDALRLLSFINWTDTSVSREALVSAGFYNAGEGRLRCAWCGGELAPFIRFGSLGSPLDIHRMYFPNCAHAAALEAAQRMTHDASPQTTPSYSPPVQTPPNNDADRPQTIGAEQNARFLSGAASGTWKSLGVVGVAGGARHPTRAVLAARLASFDSWPADRTQQPRALAEAGFFYTGTDDQVRCFYCDGGLGKWEAGDVPWSEHAHWFPHCGYVLLIKGQEFVDACRNRQVQRTFSADTGLSSRRRNPGVNFTITDSQVDECMESGAALAALGAGLDAARVRRAITNRLRATGLPFSSSEGLIDAVLDEQLNEESWSVAPQSQRLARDILAETLRDFAHRSGIIPSSDPWESRPDSSISQSESPIRTPTPTAQNRAETNTVSREINANTTEVAPPINHDRPSIQVLPTSSQVYSEIAIADSEVGDRDSKVSRESETQDGIAKPEKKLTLEEENRQLKEARLCKVCMDSEVSVVFLPCGHLVSCARCSAALASCPLCRAAVRALVRAYLA